MVPDFGGADGDRYTLHALQGSLQPEIQPTELGHLGINKQPEKKCESNPFFFESLVDLHWSMIAPQCFGCWGISLQAEVQGARKSTKVYLQKKRVQL